MGAITEEAARRIFEEHEKKREEFCHRIEKSIPKLKKEIAEQKEILVAPEDLKKKLGLGFLYKRHPTGIYWDAKYCLWKENIYVGSQKTDGKKIIIRAKSPGDKLPGQLMTREGAIKRLTG